jgi:RNA polymerase sigma-70 factor (ECF subfamily)
MLAISAVGAAPDRRAFQAPPPAAARQALPSGRRDPQVKMMSAREPTLSDELERLYLEDGRRLRAVGGRAGAQDAEDMVHEAVARTLEAGERQAIQNPLGFVLTATRNLVLSQFRRRARGVIRGFGDEEDFADTAPGAEQSLLARERLARVLAVIHAMPPRRREAFMLHRIEELSYAQIARRMRVSIKAVEKHMSLAMAQLHREIEAETESLR